MASGNSSYVTLSDFDELSIYFEADKEIFPHQIGALLAALPSEDIQRTETAERINSIIRAHSFLPKELDPPKRAVVSDELVPHFSLPPDEAKRISVLCEQMRKIVFSSTQIDHAHKVRLLNRISAIEAETQKGRGLFDVVRGGINDLGETLGKFGSDIKPLTDRMQEVVSITRRRTKQYDQLPEPEEIKRLPKPNDETQSDVKENGPQQ